MIFRSLKERRMKYGGFSIAEVLLALAIFTALIPTIFTFSIDGFLAAKNSEQRIKAARYIQEMSDALFLKRDEAWINILENEGAGSMHIEYSGDQIQLVSGVEQKDDIEIGFSIDAVYRDGSGNIVESGGTIDLHTKKIVFSASWIGYNGSARQVNSDLYVNDWQSLSWVQTTNADFDTGTHNNTYSADVGDGAVHLEEKKYSNWYNPELSMSSYDLPGDAVSRTLTAIPNHAFVGTGTNPANLSFTHVEVNSDEPPVITEIGTFSGYEVNDVFGEENYAYMATTDDSKEVVILDISSLPYTEVGYFDASGTSDGLDVFVVGDRGYLTQGRYVRVFDLTSKTGARSQLGSVLVAGFFGRCEDIEVVGDYAYLALYNDWYELAIVDVANPASMSVLGKTDTNWQQTTSLHVSEDGNRVYFGTNASTLFDEFFIMDTTVKTGSRPVIGSYDSGGMNIKGIAIIDEDQTAVIVGTSGQEYQALNIEDEENITKGGGLDIDAGIYDVASVKDIYEEKFSYIVTGEVNSEFRIIRGGNGGGDEYGDGYLDSGSYISTVHDTGSTNTTYYSLSWTGTIPVDTDMQLQIRTGNIPDLSSEEWYGPDGTSGTVFDNPNGVYMPSRANNNRYIQYRLIFIADTISTPIFEDFFVSYQHD